MNRIMKNIKIIITLLFCITVFTGSLFAVASPYEIFADSMVLQQAMNVSIELFNSFPADKKIQINKPADILNL